MFGFPKRRWYGLVSLLVVLAVGCGDDATTATGGEGGSSGGGTDSTGGSPSTLTLTSITADGTVSADGTSDGSSGSSGDSSGESTGDTTGGVVDEPGRTASQLVGVGQKMYSRNFSMVFTLGQPTQVQSTHSSTNYRLQGGLVGANGAPP